MPPEIPLYRRRRDKARDVILAMLIGTLLAVAVVYWGDSVNWGLQ